MIKFISLFALAAFAPVAMADEPPQCITPCPPGPTVTSGANSAEAVQADVQSLRSDLRRLKARVVTLEGQQATDEEATRLAEIERRLGVLEAAMQTLDPAAIKVEVAALRDDLTALTGRVETLETEMRQVKADIAEIKGHLAGDSVPMPRVVVAHLAVGAGGFAANGHNVVSEDGNVFHASPAAGGAANFSLGVVGRPKEIPVYFGAAVSTRLSFDEGYGGMLVGHFGGTIGAAKGMELGGFAGVDLFHDPNLQAPSWMPDPRRESWRPVLGARYGYIFHRFDGAQEVGIEISASVLPTKEIEGRGEGALFVRF